MKPSKSNLYAAQIIHTDTLMVTISWMGSASEVEYGRNT